MLAVNILVRFAALCFLNSYHGLEELPREIAPTDKIRDVINQVFSGLKLKTKENKKLKEYLILHKYFVTLTQLENDSWKKIIKLTGIDSEIDNSTTDFTTVINEVLDEKNDKGEFNESNDEDVNKYIENFLITLENLKKIYLNNDSYSTVNTEVLKHLYEASVSEANTTVENDVYSAENDSDETDFWVASDTRRIYKGVRTKIKHFPFLASVQLFNVFTCAGSIIKSDLVITAASCLQLAHNNRFYRENPAFLSVRIGSHYYNGGGETIPVMEVYFHPTYTPKTLKNNLAIMRLHRAIKFSRRHKNVKKIDFDRNPWPLPMNTDGITIVGWGAKTAGNKVYDPWSNKISMSILDVYPLEDCQDIYSKEYVTRKNFCAGFISKGGGACNRDVGAPGIVHGILAGVVSFGSPTCGAPDSPTVFTKLGYYYEWIEEIRQQSVPRGRVRTTTKEPDSILTYTLTTLDADVKEYKMEPISFDKIKTVDELGLRSNKPKNFKDFVQAMFDSKELTELKKRPKADQNNKVIKKDSKAGYVDPTRHGDHSEDGTEKSYDPVQFVTAIDNFDPEISSSRETDSENANLPAITNDIIVNDIAANGEIATTPFDVVDDSNNEDSHETSGEKQHNTPQPIKDNILSKNVGITNSSIIAVEHVDETRSHTVIIPSEEVYEKHSIKLYKNIARNKKNDRIRFIKDSSTGEEFETNKSFKDNAVDEELDMQIDLLIKSLDVEKVISSEIVENFNDKKVIDDTTLLELIEKQERKEKIDPKDEKILTLLYLSENERKGNFLPKLEIDIEQQESDEKGLRTDSAYFKDKMHRNNATTTNTF